MEVIDAAPTDCISQCWNLCYTLCLANGTDYSINLNIVWWYPFAHGGA